MLDTFFTLFSYGISLQVMSDWGHEFVVFRLRVARKTPTKFFRPLMRTHLKYVIADTVRPEGYWSFRFDIGTRGVRWTSGVAASSAQIPKVRSLQ